MLNEFEQEFIDFCAKNDELSDAELEYCRPDAKHLKQLPHVKQAMDEIAKHALIRRCAALKATREARQFAAMKKKQALEQLWEIAQSSSDDVARVAALKPFIKGIETYHSKRGELDAELDGAKIAPAEPNYPDPTDPQPSGTDDSMAGSEAV